MILQTHGYQQALNHFNLNYRLIARLRLQYACIHPLAMSLQLRDTLNSHALLSILHHRQIGIETLRQTLKRRRSQRRLDLDNPIYGLSEINRDIHRF